MITEARLIEMLQVNAKLSNQKEVANQLGISPQYLNDILNHRRYPGEKVCRALGLRRVVMYEENPSILGQ